MNLLRSSTITIGGVLGANVLTYGFHLLAARMLGPEGYGVFGSLMSLFFICAMPAAALGFTVIKFAARYHSDNDLGKIRWFTKRLRRDVLLVSGCLLVFFIILSPAIADFLDLKSTSSLIFVACTISFSLLLPLNSGILLGVKKYTHFSGIAIVEAVSRLVLLVFFLSFGLGFNGAVLAYGVAAFIAYVSVYPFIREVSQHSSYLHATEMARIYRFIAQVWAANLAVQVCLHLPLLLVKHFYTSEITGYWTAAMNLSRLSLLVATSIAQVIFTEVASEKDHEQKKIILRKAMGLTAMATTVIAFFFYFWPALWMKIMFGAAYVPAAPILQGLGFAMIALGLLQLWINYKLAAIK